MGQIVGHVLDKQSVIIVMPRRSGKTTLCIKLFKEELFRKKNVVLVVPFIDALNQTSMKVEFLKYRNEIQKRIITNISDLRAMNPEIIFVDDLALFPTNKFLELITYLKTSTFVSFTSLLEHGDGNASLKAVQNKLGQNNKVYYGPIWIGDKFCKSFDENGIVL
ncbi:MAG: hypothetical protein KAS32_09900 [Candidatus Peribacteraceae bacterium]|nr:hypothetical protein [Candidatus Peribacteraceae bacterium]